MPLCKNCGEEITVNQNENFFRLCSACVRGDKTRKRRGGTSLICIGLYLFIFLLPTLISLSLFNPIFLAIGIPLVIIPILMIIFGYKKRKEWKIKLEISEDRTKE